MGRPQQTQQECLFCSKVLHSKWGLEYHMNQHFDERPYQCDKCGKSYHDNRYLWNHKRNYHQKIEYDCGKCDYTTNSYAKMYKHKKFCTNYSGRVSPKKGSKSKRKRNVKVIVRKSVVQRPRVQKINDKVLSNISKKVKTYPPASTFRSHTKLKQEDDVLLISQTDNPTPGSSKANGKVQEQLQKLDVQDSSDQNPNNKTETQKPQQSYPDLVYLPLDDPRVILASQLFPPFKKVTHMDPPEHPPNIFFSVNGQVTIPFLSLQHYQAWRPPASPKPVYPDSDDYLDEEEEEDNVTDNITAPTPGPSTGLSGRSGPYVCHKCGMEFDFPSSLANHMPKHSKIRPFACQFCESRFNWKGNLLQHEYKVHGKPTPRMLKKKQEKNGITPEKLPKKTARPRPPAGGSHVCQKCGMDFKFRCHLDNHVKSKHSNSKPFPCQICGCRFNKKGNRERHEQLNHGNSSNSQ